MRHRTAPQRGQILVMTALLLVVLVGAVGFALDAGIGYLVKARLNSAVDAAGVAAARSVVLGSTQVEQAASARAAATNFFNANYPANYWYSTATLAPPTVTFQQGKVTIDIRATAVVPVHFMQVMGFDLLNVSSAARVVRKDLDMAFVMDTTDSMVAVAPTVRSAAVSFLGHFSPTTDRVALIHFSDGAVVDVPFKADQSRGFDRATMTTRINALSFNGFTNYSEGFWNARDQLNNHIAAANRSSLRVVVFFSDGSPNTFASYFAFRNAGDCNLSGSLQTGAGGSGNPDGLWYHDQQSRQLPGNCYRGTSIGSYLTSTALPAWYNPHDKAGEHEFPVVTATPRRVTSAPNWTNVNRASRNLPEAMAAKSGDEGVYVFTLGLGAHVHDLTGPDNESGETLLKCMANTSDSSCHDATRPVGTYCWAATENDLKPCFSKLASEIMRITR
jgi:Flp pilus assembly protein TadG